MLLLFYNITENVFGSSSTNYKVLGSRKKGLETDSLNELKKYKYLFQSHSANSHLQAKVWWFRPSWSHLSTKQLNKKAIPAHMLRLISALGCKSALGKWTVSALIKGAKLDSKIGLYFTHRNGLPFLGLNRSYFWFIACTLWQNHKLFLPFSMITFVRFWFFSYGALNKFVWVS